MKGHNYGLCKKCGKVHIHPMLGKSRPYHSAKMSGEGNPFYGKRHGEDARSKMKEARAKQTPPNLGISFSEEWRRNISIGTKMAMSSPLVRKKLSESQSKRFSTPEGIADARKGGLAPHKHLYPNFLEQKLNDILQSNFPNQFKYVGNRQVTIGNRNPDFVSTDGKKQVIELFGDYWHRNDNPEERIARYKEVGWDALVIWEHELSREEDIVGKINQFIS